MSDAWASPSSSSSSAPVTNTAEIGDVTRNFGILLRRGGGRLLMAYVAVTCAAVVLQVPGWLLNILINVDPGNDVLTIGGGVATLVWGIVQIIAGLLLAVWSTGLARGARTLLVDPDQVGGAGSLLKLATTRYLWTGLALLLYFVLLVVGLCFFVLPGFAVAFFLSGAIWLVAATDMELGAAFEKSYRLALANLPVMAIYFAVMVAVALVLGVLNLVATMVLAGGGAFLAFSLSYDYALLLNAVFAIAPALFSSLLYGLVGYPLSLFTWSTMSAIELADAGIQVKEDAIGEF